MPDLIFTLAFAGWTMTVVFLVASFASDAVTEGDAGRILARLFAAALALTSFLGFALGLLLLRGERGTRDHYVVPAIVGVLIGVLESVLFLLPAANFLFAPFLLLVFAFRGVRRAISRTVNGRRSAAR
ncbi:MAG: hypothetical protein ABIP13_04090 [Tepidiformaceae bacterium]